MLNPFEVWSPAFYAPFSGDVTQEITPRILSPDIKGSPVIEHRVQTEVASYGRQLGKVLDALMLLAAKTETPLPEISQLLTEIEAVKLDAKEALHDEAHDALSRLKAVDADAHAKLIADLKAHNAS
ncbi:hypothetical protein ACJ5NV_00200 [Loktanella agnita]|uniref:hypothetical protein n=1 Tax=Loktanella agnita TaxID=287097 RepID=UPI0039866E15